MREDLLEYYQRELTFLRQMGAEFADRYPKVASRLILERTKCDDPHVERLLEAFAFLTARLHLKIDDDIPEISQSLMQIVYPHYIRPIPSLSVVQFHIDPEQGKLSTGYQIPRESMLYSRPVNGTPCKFRTCFDTTIWPLSVERAEWRTPERITPPLGTALSDVMAVIRLDLRCFTDVSFDKLELDSLRLFINAEGNIAFTLYELLANNCRGVIVRDPTPGSKLRVDLPAAVLRPAGFEENEALLPTPLRAFPGYRLLQEYFAFPQKFLFFDLGGFRRLKQAGFGSRAEVLILLSPFERSERQHGLEVAISNSTFRTSCTTAVNLFEQTSEPILLDQRRHEYLITPDARRKQSTEIYSVDDVTGVMPHAGGTVRYTPFYSWRHGEARDKAYWFETRRPCSWRTDGATDIYVSFVDRGGHAASPDEDAITLRLMCFNRDLPSRLPFGNEDGDFELEGGGPIRRVVALVKPTPVIQPPLEKALHWRLISQLSLNYLSIVDGGADGLREILRLNNFGEETWNDRQILGLLDVRSRPALTQITSEDGVSFVRGRHVDVELDEDNFAGGGVYMFASLLERFLGLYVSLNSFSVLTARTRQRKEVLREWPPRAGSRVLL